MWTKVVKTTVALIALANLAFGALAFIAPWRVVRILDLEPGGRAAYGEIRAMYGGMLLGVGVITVMGLWRPSWLRALSFGWAGLAAGRAVSIFMDGYALSTLSAGFFEGIIAIFLFYASARLAK